MLLKITARAEVLFLSTFTCMPCNGSNGNCVVKLCSAGCLGLMLGTLMKVNVYLHMNSILANMYIICTVDNMKRFFNENFESSCGVYPMAPVCFTKHRTHKGIPTLPLTLCHWLISLSTYISYERVRSIQY